MTIGGRVGLELPAIHKGDGWRETAAGAGAVCRGDDWRESGAGVAGYT